ncbi:hypothetical protein DFR37_102492 [Eoetvoesiella caeni]|uniref:Transposase n=1 Tax=Eoetvoesiella caeni TaxID=645616 RepID=A0A366HJK7_9BURK|nr:hypothetical protein DFR37_102492 [Eoetvoesiella caeni]
MAADDCTLNNNARFMRACQYGMAGRLPKYGGMDTSMMARLKELEAENTRLKKMYAEERLKAEMVQEALRKKW